MLLQINAPPPLHLDDKVLQIKWKFYPDLNRKEFNQFKPVYWQAWFKPNKPYVTI